MHKGKYVFSQLLDFLDRNDFNYLARKYGGDKYVKQFTCYNQLCVLMFGQLSNYWANVMEYIKWQSGLGFNVVYKSGVETNEFIPGPPPDVHLHRNNVEKFWKAIKYEYIYLLPE